MNPTAPGRTRRSMSTIRGMLCSCVQAHGNRLMALAAILLAFQAPTADCATLLTTVTNPVAAQANSFGYTVAFAGGNDLLIGDPNFSTSTFPGLGAAYLYDEGGTLLTTFANPTPGQYESFGTSLAAAGPDRVWIGASGDSTGANYAGSVYLFELDGTLLTTITNPAPSSSDLFGYAVAALGADRVVISAINKSIGSVQDGAAYIYAVDGTLLNTITNPIPGPFPYDRFGSSVAVIHDNLIAIGAYLDEPDETIENAGVVHLINTNGALQVTIPNPNPLRDDWFGYSAASVGTNQILVGAYKDDEGAPDTGIAYIFNSNGSLAVTVTNPAPESADYFGFALAAVGTDRFLVSAPNDRAGIAGYAGVVHLYSIQGVLQNTITNPTPVHNDDFGQCVAGIAGRALAGAPGDDAGGSNTGTAYLFDIGGGPVPAPVLTIAHSGVSEIELSWVSDMPGFMLQQKEIMTNDWHNAASGTNNPAVLPTAHPCMYFRLHKP